MPKAKDYDDDIDELIEAAELAARNGKEEDFTAEMRAKYDECGDEMFLSERQYDWLVSIAEGN